MRQGEPAPGPRLPEPGPLMPHSPHGGLLRAWAPVPALPGARLGGHGDWGFLLLPPALLLPRRLGLEPLSPPCPALPWCPTPAGLPGSSAMAGAPAPSLGWHPAATWFLWSHRTEAVLSSVRLTPTAGDGQCSWQRGRGASSGGEPRHARPWHPGRCSSRTAWARPRGQALASRFLPRELAGSRPGGEAQPREPVAHSSWVPAG